jgi:pyruvate/2-oxoglutarate dehydrogenase complex dihydrolipoamide acyltransferase (E2) component
MGMRVVVPAVGWAETGVLREWHKEDGDWIAIGAPLCTLQIGASKHALTALDSGFLRMSSRKAAVGTVVRRGDLLGLILAPGESSEPLVRGIPAFPARAARSADTHEGYMVAVTKANPQRRRISPRARRAARYAGLRWERLQGSGVNGRIVARDVEPAARLRSSPVTVPLQNQLIASATFAVAADKGLLDFQAAADDLMRRIFNLLLRHTKGSASEFCFGFSAASGLRYCLAETATSLTTAAFRALRASAYQKSPSAAARWLLQDVVADEVATIAGPLAAGYHGAVIVGKDQDVLRATVIVDQRHVSISDVLQLLRALRGS